jgi:hypothetical protein
LKEGIIMKPRVLFLSLLTLLITTTAGYAVTYTFPTHGPSPVEGKSLFKMGTEVYLFHSRSEDAKNVINSNVVLTVFRAYPPDFSLGSTEAGKVRILFPLEDSYLEGEVVEGEMQLGFLVKKDQSPVS